MSIDCEDESTLSVVSVVFAIIAVIECVCFSSYLNKINKNIGSFKTTIKIINCI